MPSLNFPTTTTVGEQYLDWVWNGTGWDSLQTLPGGLPAGSIIQWGGATAPVNWLLCDGSAVSRTTYASLFAAVGTSYGTGDGTTTFNLPDLRGRVPVGKNGGSFGTLGATGGAETVAITQAQLPAVTGDVRLHGGETGSSLWQPTGVFSTSDIYSQYKIPGGSSAGATSVGPLLKFNNGGQGQAHNNLQPYQVVNYIIKATAAVTPGESELAPRVGVLEATNTLSQNYIINGAFDIWQGGTSFTSPASATYQADRFITFQDGTGVTRAITRQAFAPGTSPISGMDTAYFLRYSTTVLGTTSYQAIQNRVEDVRTLAGKTATFSFYAKADAAKTITLNIQQAFGSGGSSTVVVNTSTTYAVTTSWQRFTTTVTIPSLSGKTIGSSSFLQVGLEFGAQLLTLDLCGWQLEQGAIATSFRRNASNIQGELAACQRYFQTSYLEGVSPGTATYNGQIASGGVYEHITTSYIACQYRMPVPMRTLPTVTLYSSATGASAKVNRDRMGVSAADGDAYVDSGSLGTTVFTVYSQGSTNASQITFHFTARAEL